MLESNAEAIMNGKGDQSAFQTEEILRKVEIMDHNLWLKVYIHNRNISAPENYSIPRPSDRKIPRASQFTDCKQS